MTDKRDVFLCHASEDKGDVLSLLIPALEEAGVTYWYDEAEIDWGDSLIKKVNEGLRISRLVMVVLSKAFVKKPWPQREMNAALNLEAATGQVLVLPLLCGTPDEQKMIRDLYPLLNDKKFMKWDDGIPTIVKALKKRLSRDGSAQTQEIVSRKAQSTRVVLPKIPKEFSQREKDLYIREAFQVIRKHFEGGVTDSHPEYPELAISVEEIHKQKFVCSIYWGGEVVSRCKIWIGGLGSSDGISYAEGTFLDINNDNSINDDLIVDDSKGELGLRSTMGRFSYAEECQGVMSAQKSADYLWKRVTDPLQHVRRRR